ncbi:methionyl-tRNA formyltransferase [Hathewaya histolytica]|uniref:Methionyl-tRNA formyltransferase n=1 Tax=Hathewaya histolytica TaxID=1498 RepID=A0A4U9REM2_HATHI|nr:methionyl-tRNA formyltransferase [Hathewaya histolytica]VTQ90149.1 methionyl-tRNA formyltransferase [Hathewaya histolytica]
MKIVFMGTPDFAVPSLKALLDNFDVKAVLTQPDKPKGRGKKLSISPVKELALQYNIPVYQPVKLKNDEDVKKVLKDIEPDFMVVVAFGQILTKEILDIPKYGCINLHGSLLPKYRGAAPINWSIINGEKVTGNTTMLMNEGLDTGDMLLKDEVEISDTSTAGEIHDILMERGAKLLIETIDKLLKCEIKPIPQKDTSTMYASMLNKDMARINWEKSAREINLFIRGLNPWPIAYTHYEDKIMKIYEAEIINKDIQEPFGTILKVTEKGIEVACGEGVLLIKKIQFPGKKSMEVGEYIKGNNINVNTVLGD